MRMTASLRDLMLTIHVTTSVGWIGAVGVFLAHALAGLLSHDEQMVRAVSLAMGISAWFVILPLSLASLATGVVQALGTSWGLMRHYWIVFKLLLTVAATVVLLLKLGPISYLGEMAAEPSFSTADLAGLRKSVMVHAAGGLVVLLIATVLAVYKPKGMTPYGIRKRNEQAVARAGSARLLSGSTPRWVKGFAVVIMILLLMIFAMLLSGGHG